MKLTKPIMMIIVVVLAVMIVAAVILLSGPASDGDGAPSDTNPVSITGSLTFSPGDLTIHVGENVTWTNDASVVHTVVSDGSSLESFSSGTLTNGETYTHRFDQIGDYPYHCSIHPSMTGTIHVIARPS